MSKGLVEKKLNSVRRRWKWLELSRWLGVAGSVFCLLWFGIQLAAWRGLLAHREIFYLLIFGMVMAALATLVVIFLVTESRQEKRSWLARALERSCPPLMDRVNTLIFLDNNPRRVASYRMKSRIEEQAESVIAAARPARPFSARDMLVSVGLFFLLLTGVVLFQKIYNPFKGLLAEAAPPEPKSAPFELAAPRSVTEVNSKKTWGEVRIVDPGHDVKLTKVDVLPLQIEMTTSDAMEKPVWVTSVDGQEEIPHELAAPTDPNYMVYQPLIYLDELKVSDWDVVSYYAKVQSAAPGEYTSPLNFIEIRPFREDIIKEMGKNGKMRYGLLSELTGLIKTQTNLLQQTHQHQNMTYAQDDLRLQDAKKLSVGENELAKATNQYYGKIASEGENTPVGDILDELSQAEAQMNLATPALRDDVVLEGKQREQGALTHLIACRKAFQKVINNDPSAFGGDSDPLADQPPVTATESLKALSQVSEMHDRDQAALQSLQQLTAREQALSKSKSADSAALQHQQMQIRTDLHELMDQNADLFHGSEPEQAVVQTNMMHSIVQLSTGHPFAAKNTMALTADSLKDLAAAADKNHTARQMEQAYRLKKIIDQNARQLAQEKAKPGSLSDQQVQALAASAQRSTATLKDIVDSDQGRNFGPKLGQALSPANQQALDNSLSQFSSASGSGRGAAAGAAEQGLQGVSQAFEQSQPELTNQLRGHDQLKPSPGDALDQAAQQLQSMILAAQSHHSPSPADKAKAMAQIDEDLRAGLADSKMDAAGQAKVLADAQTLEKKGSGESIDVAELKKLLDEIESVRVEANDPNRPKAEDLNTTQVDPSKFPPAYRERLRSYFEKLSEQAH